MKALVTGSNGFMGSNLVKKLLDNGHQVRAMVLKGTNETFLKDLNCEIIYADIIKHETLVDALDDVEVVYHLAAWPSDGWSNKIKKTNLNGTKNMLNESIKRGVKRFIYMSSLVVHGFDNFNEADEDTPLIKLKWYKRPYVKSKVLCEQFLKNNRDRIEIVIIRPGFMPFGPNDMLASKEMFSRIDAGKSIPTINQGKSKAGYVYVENLCEALELVGTHPKAAGQIYIISDQNPPYITMKDYNNKLYGAFGKPRKKQNIPYGVALIGAAIVDFIYRIFMRKKRPLISTYLVNVAKHDLHFSSDKIRKELGYKQAIGFDDAIIKTVSWYKSFFSK